MSAEREAALELQLGEEILAALRERIVADLPFFGPALSAFTPAGNDEIQAFATDGSMLFFPPERLRALYRTNERFLTRMYLHTLLHCLYGQLWTRGERELRLWNLACDIAVERALDGLEKPCTVRAVSLLRRDVYAQLKDAGFTSAAQIYRRLTGKGFGVSPEMLAREFFADDHRYWEQPQGMAAAGLAKEWRERGRQAALAEKLAGQDSGAGEEAMRALLAAERKQRSYAEFLRKFAQWQEELSVSEEEFDLAYYTYGLSLYGDLPLIEPLETREEQRIRTFVIVIDTSDSTSGEPVRRFLEETFTILFTRQAFFRISEIHILQADDRVRSETVVRSISDAERLMQSFTLLGGGGTDFRPAFAYVEEQRKKGSLRDLGGLLYFTDGRGTYPQQRPPFRTAFLFSEDVDDQAVPPWAYRHYLERE